MPVLHVTNGDCAVERLRAAGFDAPALPWRDVLHDGPVPHGSDDALREVRARFLAERGWTTLDAARAELQRRDATLHEALADPAHEIVLWFEHDLYDQLQLAQVLDLIERQPGRAARVRMVHADSFLGQATPEQLQAWHTMAHDLTEAELAAGRVAWDAVRAPDPRPIEALAGTTRVGALPFMRAALRRLLDELPGRRDGLSRTERQLLEAVAGGAATGVDAYAASQAREEAIWLGDSSAAWYLERLASCRTPLVRCSSASERQDGSPLAGWTLALTADGERVVGGTADHVALNGVARWLGGTLLDGLSPWRVDGGRVVRVAIE